MRILFKPLLLCLALSAPALAADPCSNPPDVARVYLAAHSGWHILSSNDLYPDDRVLWAQYRKGLCPGMTEVDFDGSGRKHVALALLRHSSGRDLETIVLLRAGKHGLEEHVIYTDFPAYCVIWRTGPGTAQEWDSPKKIRIRHDSLVVEHLESASQQFYWANGKFRYVQTSD
jgi:hypothetical protein